MERNWYYCGNHEGVIWNSRICVDEIISITPDSKVTSENECYDLPDNNPKPNRSRLYPDL